MISYKPLDLYLPSNAKPVIFYVAYLVIFGSLFGSLLWSVGNIDGVKTAEQYENAFNVFGYPENRVENSFK